MPERLTPEQSVEECVCGHWHGYHGSIFGGSSGECYEPDSDCTCQHFELAQGLPDNLNDGTLETWQWQ